VGRLAGEAQGLLSPHASVSARAVSSYRVGLGCLVLAYIALYGLLLVWTGFRPYVLDNNESYSALIHASNMYQFGVAKSFGLTDEAYGPNPLAHPYIHTHQGNMPRLFAFVLYAFGARTIESQIAITTFTVGLLGIAFVYHYFAKTSGAAFALMGCLTMMTDYVLFAQWQVNTYRVWHVVFVFSSLLCAHGIGEPRKRLWSILTVMNYALLFYFEFIFVAFVSMFVGLYCVCLYVRSPSVLFRAWKTQAAGAACGMLILLLQLAGYLGWAGLATDIRLTYVARNAAGDPRLLPKLQQFYEAHNIVFWYNLVDSTPLRSIQALVRTFFYWNFQVHTPVLSLIVLTMMVGACVGLIESSPFGVRLKTTPDGALRFVVRWAGRYDGMWSAVGRLQGRLLTGSDALNRRLLLALPMLRATLRWLPLLVGACLLFRVLVRYTVVAGVAWHGSRSRYGGLLLTSVVLCGGIALSLGLSASARGVWRRLGRVPLHRIVMAFFTILWLERFVRHHYELYDQSLRPLWLGSLQNWAPDRMNQVAVLVAVVLATNMVLLGTRRVLGAEQAAQVVSIVRYLACGFAAYAVVYMLSPGYVMSGYLERSAPLTVFLTDVLVAGGFYVMVIIGGQPLWRQLRSGRQTPWQQQLDSRWGAGRVRQGVWCSLSRPTAIRWAVSGLALSLTLFSIAYWIHLQSSYARLLPATHFSFLHILRDLPYRGASFVVSTYAAPVSSFTEQWAYYDRMISSGNVMLVDSGYLLERDARTYLWLADRWENREYLKPRYYVCMVAQTQRLAAERLVDAVPPDSKCSSLGLVRNALSGDQEGLHHRVVVRDESGRDSWAIIELDWEYPPYLEAFPEGAGNARVRVTLRDREDGALLHVSYRYAHQEGAPERGSVIRLYRLTSNGAMKALRETTPREPLVLPPGSTGQFVASVTPRTSSKSGREYFSDPFGAGARIAERLPQ